ncbi:MAG: type II toxin-antitoxin system RelE/ParE family toxin [Dehalococcoidia bacterium]|nr:type II toxin-antitoxin system RelE/ParE family toxin [Dehalococcoidia bacterium]
MYSIEVTPAADRDLDVLKNRMQRRDFERLRGAIRGLAGEPRPQGVTKLRGAEGVYRIRVGPYRVVYDILDDRELVVILKVARRSETTYSR